jgi:hypothetical protein
MCQSDRIQGILLDTDVINYESRTKPDYEITVVAERYFELAE